MEAVNEAVANALVHAFYGSSASVKATLRADELEVVNPGSLLVDRAVAIAGGFSEARNPTLMRLFTFMGASDRAGSGIQKIYRTWRREFGVEPHIIEGHGPENVRIVLPLVAQKQTGKQASFVRFTDADLLELISNAPNGITGRQVAQMLGISERTAQNRLKNLTGTQLVRQKDGHSYRYYIVK